MEFDSVTQKLGCPSCGMQIDVREYEQKYSQNSTQGEYDKEMKMLCIQNEVGSYEPSGAQRIYFRPTWAEVCWKRIQRVNC